MSCWFYSHCHHCQQRETTCGLPHSDWNPYFLHLYHLLDSDHHANQCGWGADRQDGSDHHHPHFCQSHPLYYQGVSFWQPNLRFYITITHIFPTFPIVSLSANLTTVASTTGEKLVTNPSDRLGNLHLEKHFYYHLSSPKGYIFERLQYLKQIV